MVGYVVAAWAVDLDVANGILPGYIMGLYFFTGYALRLQVINQSSQSSCRASQPADPSGNRCNTRVRCCCLPHHAAFASAAVPLYFDRW